MEELYEVEFSNTTMKLPAEPAGIYVRRVGIGRNYVTTIENLEFLMGDIAVVDGLVRSGSDSRIFVRVYMEEPLGGEYVDILPKELEVVSVYDYRREEPPMPPIGSVWKHHNGNVYEVYDHTNVGSTKEQFPPRISYRNTATGAKYSRDLSDWHRSMRAIGGTIPAAPQPTAG